MITSSESRLTEKFFFLTTIFGHLYFIVPDSIFSSCQPLAFSDTFFCLIRYIFHINKKTDLVIYPHLLLLN